MKKPLYKGVKRQLIRNFMDSPNSYPTLSSQKVGASSRAEAGIFSIEGFLPVSIRTFSLSIWVILNCLPEGVSEE
jgi:hypothetical protein